MAYTGKRLPNGRWPYTYTLEPFGAELEVELQAEVVEDRAGAFVLVRGVFATDPYMNLLVTGPSGYQNLAGIISRCAEQDNDFVRVVLEADGWIKREPRGQGLDPEAQWESENV